MKKKSGFTLIELLVVMVIISILSITFTTKLRESIAKAKDSKAIAVLGVARITAEIIFIDQIVQDVALNSGVITSGALSLNGIFNRLNLKTQEVYYGGTNCEYLKIGGSRDGMSGEIVYGGVIGLDYPEIKNDSIQLNFRKEAEVDGILYGNNSVYGGKWISF